MLSGPFIASLSDRELRAIMAHEVSHLAAGDLDTARSRQRSTLVVLFAVACAILSLLNGRMAFPVEAAAVSLSLVLLQALVGVSNRPREWRADREGAPLCEDPAAMAAALRHTAQFSR